MRRLRVPIVAFAVTVVATSNLLVFGGAQAQRGGQQSQGLRRALRSIPNEYIVVLAPGEDGDAIGPEAARTYGGRLQRVYRAALKGFSIRLSPAAAERLADDPRVLFVEEDAVVEVEQSAATWGLDRIDQRLLPLDGLAHLGASGSDASGLGVDVHVVDTGIRVTHQEFGGRAFNAGDFVDDDENPSTDAGNDDAIPGVPDGDDCHGHGTHVAGTIGGATYGVAENVRLYGYRVFNCTGTGSVSKLLTALDTIALQSLRPAVVNLSLSSEPSDAIDEAVRNGIAAGIVVVAAAGNSNYDAQYYSPARVEEAITVGATAANDTRASFSNFGAVVDLFAPGMSVLSAWRSSNTATQSLSGTSMAAPHVAGAAALYLERNPLSTPEDTRNALVTSATRNVVPSPAGGPSILLLYAGGVADTPPDVSLVAPNTSVKVFTATPYTIEWTADDADGFGSFDVLFSTDGGTSYAPLPGCSGLAENERSCVWAMPGPVTNKGRIKVIGYDALGTPGQDVSDVNFSIVAGAATVTVSSPNTAVKWARGSRHEIKWSHNVGSNAFMRIELSRDGGTTFPEVLAASVKNTSSSAGSFFWYVTGPNVSTAVVRVSWTSGPVSDVSNVAFQIVDPLVTVTSPTSTSVNWGFGTTQLVKWTHNTGVGTTFDVHLSTDGGVSFPIVLAAGVTGTQVQVTTPTLGAAVTTARVRVKWTNAPAGITAEGQSAANFKIEPAFVTLSKPNGGEIWTVETAPKISWVSNLGSLESVRLELSTDGGVSYPTVILPSTPSDGSQTVTVDAAWVTAAAKVRAVWLDNVTVTDASNATFVIR
jgi:subtilisin family serine protease